MRGLKFSAPNRVLLLLCIMYMIVFVNRVNISTAAPLIKVDLGLSNTQLGLAFSAFAYPFAFFQLVGGWLGDKFGARRTLFVCILIVCVATALTGMVSGLTSLFLTRVALGFGEGPTFPTATQAMARWLPEGRWGFAQGITHTFARLGNSVTPPIVAALVVWLSWRASFYILAAVSLCWVVVWLWYFRDEPGDHPSVKREDLAALRPRVVGVKRRVPWWRLARRIAPVTAVDFCYGWNLWLFLSWIPFFFAQAYELDLAHSALFSSGVFLAGVVGDTLGGSISDAILRRTGSLVVARRSVIMAGFLGGGIFLIPVVLFHDLTVSTICLCLAFFFAELIVAPIWAVPMDIAPQYAGSASGLMNFGFGLAGITSPFLFGYLVDLTGTWTIPFMLSIALLFLGMILTLALRPDIPFVAEDQE